MSTISSTNANAPYGPPGETLPNICSLCIERCIDGISGCRLKAYVSRSSATPSFSVSLLLVSVHCWAMALMLMYLVFYFLFLLLGAMYYDNLINWCQWCSKSDYSFNVIIADIDLEYLVRSGPTRDLKPAETANQPNVRVYLRN